MAIIKPILALSTSAVVLMGGFAADASAAPDSKEAYAASRGDDDATRHKVGQPTRADAALVAKLRKAFLRDHARSGPTDPRAVQPLLAPDTTPTITAPASGATVSGDVLVQVTSTAPFVRIEFGAINTVVAGDGAGAQATFDTYSLEGAQGIVAADCSDAAGLDCGTSSPVVPVTVNNPAPVLTSPADGQIVALTVEAAATSSADAVAFMVDGVEFGYDDSAPFAATISTDGLTEGVHQMTAINCDSQHRCAEATPSNVRTFDVRDRLFPSFVSVRPPRFNPSGPARVSDTTLTYELDVSSVVSLTIRKASGQLVRGPVSRGTQGSGNHSWTWTGRNNNGAVVGSGRYVVEIDTKLPGGGAEPAGHDSTSVVVDSSPARITGIGSTPRRFYPARDGFKDSTSLRGRLNEDVASLKVRIQSPRGKTVRTINAHSERAGSFHVTWNGRTSRGAQVPAGKYTFRYLTVDELGNSGRSRAGSVRVSDKRLVRYSFRKTVSARNSLTNNASGACSDLFSPGARAWSGSLGYYSDFYCTGDDTDDVALGLHAVKVPRAFEYGRVRLTAYGGAALVGYSDRAVGFVMDRSGELIGGRVLTARVGSHPAGAARGSDVVTGAGRVRWVMGTTDLNWYDVQTYTVRLSYLRLE